MRRGKCKASYKIVITEVKDENGDGRVDLADVEWLIKNRKNVLTKLKGDGDFRIKPWSKGGRTVAENCQMLCADCNRRKGGK